MKILFISCKKIFISIFILFVSSNALAFTLTGTWKLISAEMQTDKNSWKPYCNSPTGLLLYTPQGYMAAGFNCMQKQNAQKPSYKPEDMTFYMGKYILKDNQVTHIVTNSSDPTYYGKNLEREIQPIDQDDMYLVVKQDGKQFRLKWHRA